MKYSRFLGSNKLWGIKKGERVIFEPQFKAVPENINAQMFLYGLAVVLNETNQYVLIDENGEIRIEGFDKIAIYPLEFKQSLVIVQKGEYYGLYDPQQDISTEIAFRGFQFLERGFQTVTEHGLGVITDKFQEVLKPLYKETYYFGNDTYKGVMSNGKEVISSLGWEHPSEPMDIIWPLVHGFYRAQNNGWYYFITAEGNILQTDSPLEDAIDFDKYGVSFVRVNELPYMLDNDGTLSTAKKFF